jgi:hypothetical protein
MGLSVVNFYNCRKEWREQGEMVPPSRKEPERWSAAEEFTVVLESAELITTEQGATAVSGGCTQICEILAPRCPGWQRKASAHLVDEVRRVRRAGRAEGAGEAPCSGPAENQGLQEGDAAQGEGPRGGRIIVDAKKNRGLLHGRGRMLTSKTLMRKHIELIDEDHTAGTSLISCCIEIAMNLHTLKGCGKNA